MMKKNVKRKSAVFLALVLTLSALALPRVNAANPVDVEKNDCSIEFKTSGDDKIKEDLNTAEVLVKLYRVAEIDSFGEYTAIGDFEKLEVSALDAEKASSAKEWKTRAEKASKMVKAGTEVEARVSLVNGIGTTGKKLPTGLYLVMAEKTLTSHYEYTFTPYLISLPNNYYYGTGNDDWVYDLTEVSLKPEQKPRYGDLVIEKELLDLNTTFGDKATFVFQIDIETLDHKKSSRVEELTMEKEPGTKQLVVTKIPAGATVMVKEVYSGASYRQISDDPEAVTIYADEMIGVRFVNEHDGRSNGGYGVNNHFEQDEEGQYQYSSEEAQ